MLEDLRSPCTEVWGPHSGLNGTVDVLRVIAGFGIGAEIPVFQKFNV